MSARASRLRLEEELRRIVEQEETLDGDVKQLLQVRLFHKPRKIATVVLYTSSPAAVRVLR